MINYEHYEFLNFNLKYIYKNFYNFNFFTAYFRESVHKYHYKNISIPLNSTLDGIKLLVGE